MPTTQERVLKITAEQLGVAPETVKLDSRFVGDLGGDSLDVVELCMALEDEFDVEIPDNEASQIHTPADAIAWLERQPAKA